MKIEYASVQVVHAGKQFIGI